MTKRKKKALEAMEAATPPSQGSAYWPWIAVGIIVLAFAAIRIRLLQMPLERDEGEFAYMGQLMLQGIPPYELAYNMKLPGIYAVYALMMALFGQTIAGVHLGLILFNSISIALMFVLGRRLLDPIAGVVAAAAFAVMSIHPGVLGTSAHATQFQIPFILGACLYLLKAVENDRPGALFGSGLLLGLAFLLKQHAAAFILFGAFYYVWSRTRERPIAWKRTIGNTAVLGAGAVIPFIITCVILAAQGVFARFWFWTFTYAHQYVTELPLSTGLMCLRISLGSVAAPCSLIWGLAALGIPTAIWCGTIRKNRAFLLGFLVFGSLATSPGMFFRNHYFVLMLPAVALMVGAAVKGYRDWLMPIWGPLQIIPLLAAAVALVVPLGARADFLFRMSPVEACRTMYFGNPFPESVEIADYIAKHTTKDDVIAVVGSEPQIYFYSKRHSATGFIYTYGLMEEQEYASKMQLEMIREIESKRPKFVVFVSIPMSWLAKPNSDMTILKWTQGYCSRLYDLVGACEIFEDRTETYWGRDAQSPHAEGDFRVFVLERKPGR